DGEDRRLHRSRFAPLRRDRRHHHRRYRSGHQRIADQDRFPGALGPTGQVQPAAAHRGGPRRRGELRRAPRVLSARLGLSSRMVARLVGVLLLLLVASLQYGLWLGKGSWLRVWEIDRKVVEQRRLNDAMAARNAALDAEVQDLREGLGAIEER